MSVLIKTCQNFVANIAASPKKKRNRRKTTIRPKKPKHQRNLLQTDVIIYVLGQLVKGEPPQPPE